MIDRKIKKSLIKDYIKHKYLIFMMLPGLIYFIIFKYIPIYGLLIAFKDYKFKLGVMGSPFVGFSNFVEMFQMQSFWQVVGNTFYISILQLIFFFPLSILFALLLNEVSNVYFKKFTQTVSYLPHFISWVVLGGLFSQLLSLSGPVNSLIASLNLKQVNFLAEITYFRPIVVVTHIWKDVGWASIVYLAALTGISQDLYEAATVDGANRFQKILNITIPCLAPIATVMLIVQVGKVVNDNFEQIYNLYSPAVYSVGDVISTYIFRRGIGDMQYSFTTAVGLFKNIIAFILVITANGITKKINEYGIW